MAYHMNYDSKKDVAKQYKDKLRTPDEAVKCVKSGDWVTYGFFNCKPVACDKALARRKEELSDVNVWGAVTTPPYPRSSPRTLTEEHLPIMIGIFHF